MSSGLLRFIMALSCACMSLCHRFISLSVPAIPVLRHGGMVCYLLYITFCLQYIILGFNISLYLAIYLAIIGAIIGAMNGAIYSPSSNIICFTSHAPFLLFPSRTITFFSWKYFIYSLIIRIPAFLKLDAIAFDALLVQQSLYVNRQCHDGVIWNRPQSYEKFLTFANLEGRKVRESEILKGNGVFQSTITKN